ncbi:DNA-3-methyladenine glycosylase I [Rhodoblastus sp. 17X3]|uniref:DNA-3-methyladenine glycosylase I n=1 Tax=Rhodoblastus sp. 17X3 TaxID=3047026 RepID=UPI0024B7E311|nr:DNA-3-methyladenine glycosylase I [Rhodoblastus sp. 17X3]MDI9846986.1 DNA-3-methyladenine glycosylase I [Rhodoblastus sp. 17X3]
MATGFAAIRARAEQRKGGAGALAELLPALVSNADLAGTPDDRILAGMTRRIFCAGFVWRVIDQKWPGFEEAFLGFQPQRLAFEPDEFWERLASDTRVVRHRAKIAAVRHNAAFVCRVEAERGSFGRLLADWPAGDEIGLLAFLAKNGARLGGMTGQYFLRFIGWDAFILTRDVLAALRESGVEISEQATSKRDLAAAQEAFNVWTRETGLSYVALSRICAMSTGDNLGVQTLLQRMHGED